MRGYDESMKPPLSVRPLTAEERTQLEVERRSADASHVRHAQIILASARGLSAKPSAQLVGGAVQTVRHVIQAVITSGVACMVTHATRPKRVAPMRDGVKCERLPHILHQSPRPSGKPTGVWTLARTAEGCHEQGLTERLLSDESIRRALQRLETKWKRAKHWITRPDPP